MPKIKRKKEEQKRDPSPTWPSLGQPKEGTSVTSGGLHTGHIHSLASATQTSTRIESSLIESTVNISSSLTMSEHFQNTSLLGTANSLQLSLPVVSNAASLTGSISNFSRASAPAVSSACLLPSASGTSFQPLMGSAYLYQHSRTTMLSGVSGQSHSSTSATSYPGVFEWDITAKTAKKSSSLLRDFTATGIDQNTAVSSMSMTAQHDKTSDANIIVPLYPTLSASLVQRTQSQIPNQQGHSLSLPYQTGSQVYYYKPGTLGPQLSGELGPWLQSYGSVSYSGNRASAHQPEMVMVLKEVQPTKVLPPVSTSGMHYSVSAQCSTETSFQGIDFFLDSFAVMETSLGLQSASQTFCLAQTPEFSKSCSSRNTQILESNPSPELGDISMTAPVQSPTNLLTVSPAPSQDKTENKNLDEIKTKISKPLDAYQFPIEKQNPLRLPLEIPDIHQQLFCIDPLGQEVQPGSENANLRKNSLSLQCQGIFENGFESSSGLADVTTLVENTHLPSIFSSLQDPDKPKSLSLFSSLQNLDQPKSPSIFSSLQDLDQSKSPFIFSDVQDLDQPKSPSIFSSLQDLDQLQSPSIFTSLQDLDQSKSPSIFSFLEDLDQSKSPSLFSSLQDLDQSKIPSIFSSLQDLDQPKSPSLFSSLQDLDQSKSPFIFSDVQDLDQPKSPYIFTSLQDLDQPKSPSIFSFLQDLHQSKSPSLFSSLQDLDQSKSPSIFSSLQDLDQSKSPFIFSDVQDLDQPKSPYIFTSLQDLDQPKSPFIFSDVQDLDQPKSPYIFTSLQDLDQSKSPLIFSSLQDLDQHKSASIFSSLQDLDQPKSPSILSFLQDLDQPKSPSLFSSLQNLDQSKSPSIFGSLQDLDQSKSPSIFSSLQDLDQSKSPFIFSDLQDLDQPKSPYIFTSLQDLDQSKSPSGKKAKDPSTINVNQVQEKSSVIKSHSGQVRKNKHKAVEHIQGAPKAKIQPKNPESLLEGEVAVCSATTSDSTSVSKGKRSSNKRHKATSSRSSTTKRHGQEKTKRSRESSSKKSGDSKQSGTKVKVEEKQAIPNRKRKKNQPELSQETFKKPRTSLGMHMLESVQVFHALGKKTDKKTGFSSSQTLGSSSNTQNPRPFSALKPWLATRCEGKGPEKTQVKAQILDDNAEKESPSPSQYELPPPGKVKLILLPFLTPNKPQARPVSRRPHPPASHRPAVACPSPPGSTNSAQSTAVSLSQPAPTNTSLTGPARPAQPISTNATNATKPGSTNPNQPPIASQSAASRPAPYKTSSCSSPQWEPVCTAVTNLQSLPKSQNQFLIQDFSLQHRPWRTPNISGPVESMPITKEQRPEREAMKRKAQQERENAAKYTSLGKVQFFIQREKDMEISEYYGYRF
ncbi:hypothetical protein P7K49_029346 [Saguinus oedipus]|uniref:DUF4629 domain-containing protein n=1 Tax=Saguinus oedipus TaxID=9490 RepID=A0ABQ9U6X9_SAGOE|nr:hypothetical protein P7K49_029346 [Saguinus oedipus]